jgi:hypothetical protein
MAFYGRQGVLKQFLSKERGKLKTFPQRIPLNVGGKKRNFIFFSFLTPLLKQVRKN